MMIAGEIAHQGPKMPTFGTPDGVCDAVAGVPAELARQGEYNGER